MTRLFQEHDIALDALLGEFYSTKNTYGPIYCGNKEMLGSKTENNLDVVTPITGETFTRIHLAEVKDIEIVVNKAQQAYLGWRTIPAPKRGELVSVFAEYVRQHKSQLAKVITIECGKPYAESLGEVQEVIDVCEFAVGLSRQLYGLTIASERPEHRMMEQWHPLGVVAVITAFNFPMAVWAWNAMLALVCGDSVVWKPSEQCPLSALACHSLLVKALADLNLASDIAQLVFADSDASESLVKNHNVSLVSATGSCAMGKKVAPLVAQRMGKYLLELGGNNALILSQHANLDLAYRAIVFSALGTTGQRCTTLRRLIVHESLTDEVCNKLAEIYSTVAVGNPFQQENIMGPLINQRSFDSMMNAIEQAKQQGGKVLFGGNSIMPKPTGEQGCYVEPTLIRINHDSEIVQQETFAPILYVISYSTLEQAIEIQNSVKQGLSSSIFTDNIQEAEYFLSAEGSDCGIANVNIGTSGAEIGGAFGGEKDTGGGRESGSDAWKNYMRRTTNTINYGKDLPLAQGINFDF